MLGEWGVLGNEKSYRHVGCYQQSKLEIISLS